MKLIKLLSESMINDDAIRKVYSMALKKYGEDMTFKQMIEIMKRIFGTFNEAQYARKFRQIIKVINEIRNVSRENIINYFLNSHTVNLKDDFGDITCEIPPQNVEDNLYVDQTTKFFHLENITVILKPVGYFMYNGTRIEIKDTIYYDVDEFIEKFPVINDFENFSDEFVDYITILMEQYLIMKTGSRLDYVNVDT
jgi:hypothetical protein